jgi:maltose-binding protein MalE
MEQVKIFRSGSYSTDFIQNEINNFLKENKNKVYITHIKQSELMSLLEKFKTSYSFI